MGWALHGDTDLGPGFVYHTLNSICPSPLALHVTLYRLCTLGQLAPAPENDEILLGLVAFPVLLNLDSRNRSGAPQEGYVFLLVSLREELLCRHKESAFSVRSLALAVHHSM